MDQIIYCDSCDAHIHQTYLSIHVETYHVSPRREDIVRLSCSDCKFSTSALQKDFMIRHCLKAGHEIDAVTTEWKSFWVMEEERMNEILKSGYQLLRENEQSKRSLDSKSEYPMPKFFCAFNPLTRKRSSPSEGSSDEDGENEENSNQEGGRVPTLDIPFRKATKSTVYGYADNLDADEEGVPDEDFESYDQANSNRRYALQYKPGSAFNSQTLGSKLVERAPCKVRKLNSDQMGLLSNARSRLDFRSGPSFSRSLKNFTRPNHFSVKNSVPIRTNSAAVKKVLLESARRVHKSEQNSWLSAISELKSVLGDESNPKLNPSPGYRIQRTSRTHIMTNIASEVVVSTEPLNWKESHVEDQSGLRSKKDPQQQLADSAEETESREKKKEVIKDTTIAVSEDDAETEIDRRTPTISLELGEDEKSTISVLRKSNDDLPEETAKNSTEKGDVVAENSLVVVDDEAAINREHIFLPPANPPPSAKNQKEKSFIEPPPLGEGLEISAIEANTSDLDSSVVGSLNDTTIHSMIHQSIEESIAKTSNLNRMICTYCQHTISAGGRKANKIIKAIGHSVSHMPHLRIFICRYCDYGTPRRRCIKNHLKSVHQKLIFSNEDYEKSHSDEHAKEIRDFILSAFPSLEWEHKTPVLTYIT